MDQYNEFMKKDEAINNPFQTKLNEDDNIVEDMVGTGEGDEYGFSFDETVF